jgi:hypothetical protein
LLTAGVATGVFRDSARGVFRFRFSTTKATGNEVLLNDETLEHIQSLFTEQEVAAGGR